MWCAVWTGREAWFEWRDVVQRRMAFESPRGDRHLGVCVRRDLDTVWYAG